MAGDWIKVEHATLDKPEVLMTAELLGIDRREALGIFIEFWTWLDKNLSGSCPDFVRNVSRKSLDEVLHVPGFAACLVRVGWAEFDDEAFTMRVINAERHNGNTAKTRALDAKRKREKRLESVRETSGSQPDKNRTREEKRREEKKHIRARKTPLPENFGLSERVIDWAKQRGITNLQAHLDAFKLKAVANDYHYADWDAAFMEAIRGDWARVGVAKPAADKFAGAL